MRVREETERNREIVDMWESGAKYHEIARHFGIAKCRAQVIVQNYYSEVKMHKMYGELADLPHGVRNALLRNGITSKVELINLLCGGLFKADKGIGLAAIEAIEELTGLTVRTVDGEIPTYHNIKHKRLKGVTRRADNMQKKD